MFKKPWLTLFIFALCCTNAINRVVASSSKDPVLVLQLGHSQAITKIGFSKNGRRIVSGDESGTLKVWDTASRGLLQTIEAQRYALSMAVSPDGTQAAIGSFRDLTIWNLMSGTQAATLGGRNRVESVAWSADGRWIVGETLSGAKLWDAKTFQLQKSFEGEEYQDRAYSLGFSHDSRTLAISTTKIVRLFRISNGELLRTLPNSSLVHELRFSGDNAKLYGTQNGSVSIWNLSNGENVRKARPTIKRLWKTIISDDGTLSAQTPIGDFKDGTPIEIYETMSGKLRNVIRKTGSYYGKGLSFSPDGKTVAMSTSGSGWGAWNIATGKPVAPQIASSITPDKVWLLHESTLLKQANIDARSFRFKTGLIANIGQTSEITSKSSDGKIFIRRQNGGAAVFRLSGKKPFRVFKGSGSDVEAQSLSPDGQKVAIPDGRTLRVWLVSTGKQQFSAGGHAGGIVDTAFSPDGKFLASRAHDSGEVRVFDVSNGKQLHAFAGTGPTHSGFVFSHNSRLLAYANNSRLNIYEAQTGRKLTDSEHKANAQLAFSIDDNTLAAASSERGSLSLYKVSTGELQLTIMWITEQKTLNVAKLKGNNVLKYFWIAYTPEGFYDGSLGIEKFIRWRVDDNIFPAVEYSKQFRHSGLLRQLPLK